MSSTHVPDGLGEKAQRLWDEITADYDLRSDELRLLEDACREVDLVERLDAELGEGDLMVKGSMGQPVASPLVAELRQHRTTLARLLRSLKLPETDDGRERTTRSAGARAAAMARWGRTSA